MEEAGCVYKSAVGDPMGAELVVVAPTRARLEVVVAEMGLAEAALVGLAAAEVEIAAEASLQLALHRKSDSFYTEAHTRYHRIFKSLHFAACSTYRFYLYWVAASSFYEAQLSILIRHLGC